jgi:hypothetical protein
MTKEKVKAVPRVRRTGPGSLGETVAVWKALASNARTVLADMAHVVPDHTAFEESIAKVEASMAEQDILSARATALVHLRREDVARARSLRNKVVAHLQGKFGTESEKLREFGLKPRKRKVKPRPVEEEPEKPEPEESAAGG